jgi:site-specific recombinase XerD
VAGASSGQLDRKEQRALIRAVERHGPARDIAMVALMLHTGLRVAELAALRWTVKARNGEAGLLDRNLD